MKKLSRLKLNSATLLNDKEMRGIVGGYGNGDSSSTNSCSGGGINNTSCSGTCPRKYTYHYPSGQVSSVAQTCTASTTTHLVKGGGAISITSCTCV